VNEFGQIADDLTTLEMRVEQMLGRQHAKALKAALQRAFVEACKASRAQRLEDDEAQASEGSRGGSGQGSNSSVRRAPSRKKQSLEMRSAEVRA
jgi:hypothetical protein